MEKSEIQTSISPFGVFVDVHEAWIAMLPQNIPLRILYFCISYVVLCVRIALSNRCKMPIVPTDLFPRELNDILKIPYSRVKICFDVICLIITMIMTLGFLGQIRGLGIGTVLAAFTMGKIIGIIGEQMDKKWAFTSVFKK